MTTTKEQNPATEHSTEYDEDDDGVGTDPDATNDPDELPIFQFFPDDQQPKTEQEQQQQQEQETDVLTHQDAQQEFVRAKGLSYFAVLLNFLTSLIGAGFLSLPMAFSTAGPWYGLVLLFTIALLNFFSMSQLVRCAQHHYTRLNIPYLSYGNLTKQACKRSFGWARAHRRLAKIIVNAVTLVQQFGTCSMYYMFISLNLHQIFVFIGLPIERDLWFLIIFAPIVLINAHLSMRILSILCMIGNALMLVSLSIVVYIVFETVYEPQVINITTVIDIKGLFNMCGIIIFSCLAQPVVLPLERKMKKPRRMLGPFGVLSCGIFLSAIIYAYVGFFGFLAFEEELKGPIIDNIYNSKHKETTIFIRSAMCVSIFASFMLQMFVITGVIWPRFEPKMEHLSDMAKYGCKVLLRTLFVFVCFLIAIILKDAKRMMPLIGITTGALLVFVFPAIIGVLTFVPVLRAQGRTRAAHLRLWLNILLASFGLTIMVGGLIANTLKLNWST